jgi:hypothetical protein
LTIRTQPFALRPRGPCNGSVKNEGGPL